MLNPAVRYDPLKDLQPVSLIGTAPLVLVAPANAPGAEQGFMEQPRPQAASGAMARQALARWGIWAWSCSRRARAIAPEHIPYAGYPQVFNALMAGDLQLSLLSPALASAQAKAGKLRAIGITSMGRSPVAPEIASLADAGVKNFELEFWNAVAAPKSMPKAHVDKLAAAVSAIVRTPEMRQKLSQQGWQAVGSAPEGLKNAALDADGEIAGPHHPRAKHSRPVYVQSAGMYMPGAAVSNDGMDAYVAPLNRLSERIKRRILAENGITQRYYATAPDGSTTVSNAQMAQRAIEAGLALAGRKLGDVGFLASGSSGGDALMPGFASMIQGEMAAPPMELLSVHGVCAPAWAALAKRRHWRVEHGQHQLAVAVASEMPSRLFKKSRYAAQGYDTDFDAHFLRWDCLSDGAERRAAGPGRAAAPAPRPAPEAALDAPAQFCRRLPGFQQRIAPVSAADSAPAGAPVDHADPGAQSAAAQKLGAFQTAAPHPGVQHEPVCLARGQLAHHAALSPGLADLELHRWPTAA
ncbi:hypothetical protein FQA39_LY19213 [Lamprigera yunnana]|nr:hypothetical protein FQA39_LY19213 [Lamprigera yunnana]